MRTMLAPYEAKSCEISKPTLLAPPITTERLPVTSNTCAKYLRCGIRNSVLILAPRYIRMSNMKQIGRV
jgi:hypothetical protein